MQTIYHVVPSGQEWAVKRQGAERASRRAPTQAEAVSEAETMALNQIPSRVVVHGEDGRVMTQHTFGHGASSNGRGSGFSLWAGAAAALIGFAGAVWLLSRRDLSLDLDDARRGFRRLRERSPI